LQNNHNSFRIDASSGEITLAQSLDFESIQDIYIRIEATDGGGRTRDAPFQIFVQDANDQGPVFETDTYRTTVRENSLELIPPVTVQVSQELLLHPISAKEKRSENYLFRHLSACCGIY